MSTNPPGWTTLGRDHPPLQPGVRKGWFQAPARHAWAGQPIRDDAAHAGVMPDSWACVRPEDPSSCAAQPARRLARRDPARTVALD
jgi:hypothetical protein